jgi:outer membrane protein assembly factor BamB
MSAVESRRSWWPSRIPSRSLSAGCTVLAATVAALVAPVSAGADMTFVNWPGYLYGLSHSSLSPGTTITVANAVNPALVSNWSCPARTISSQPPPEFTASPAVYNGIVYIGCNTGVFYAVNETTPTVVWSRMLGYVTRHTCAARGISSTATVAVDPSTGAPTVYVSGGDGNLYALDAATGNVDWVSVIGTPSSTVNDYYDWSSPAVSNGHVYIGVSSQCDSPFVPGGVKEYDQHTGSLLGTYTGSLAGAPGAGVWTSPAVGGDGSVYVTTASGDKTNPGDSYSIVRLADLGGGITKQDIWTIPKAEQVGNSDFGGSPTLFTASLSGSGPTEMVGACNKNGIYYAWRASQLSAGPVWRFQVGVGTAQGVAACLGAAIWDGSHLFVPGNATTINGTSYYGSMRELDPATGTPIWETGLPGIVLGSPSMDAGGVIAAATYGPGTANGVYLINAASGAVIVFIDSGKEFAQPVFADSYLLTANQIGVLDVYSQTAGAPGGIAGQVSDAQTNAGIPGATVSCTCSGSSTTADGSGTYSFTGVAQGTYSMSFAATGHATQTISGVVVSSGNTTMQNAALNDDGGIAGTVTDATTTQPISGANVTCTCSGTSATTDGNGNYMFAGVAPASGYSMTFAATGYATQAINGVVVTPATTTTEDAQLGSGGGISGAVTDAQTHGPITGATVDCSCQTASTSTNGSGTYAFAGVTPGTYTISVSAPGHVSASNSNVVVNPGATTVQDFALTASPVVFSDGFESGNFSSWTSSRGLAIESSVVHSGTFAAEANTTSGCFARKTLPSTYTTGYGRVWFDIVGASSQVNMLRLNNASGVLIANLYVTTSKRLGMYANGTNTLSSTIVSNGSFHEIEIGLTINGTSSTTQVWFDGARVSALSRTVNLGASPIAQLQLSQVVNGTTFDVVFDDAAFDTTLLP